MGGLQVQSAATRATRDVATTYGTVCAYRFGPAEGDPPCSRSGPLLASTCSASPASPSRPGRSPQPTITPAGSTRSSPASALCAPTCWASRSAGGPRSTWRSVIPPVSPRLSSSTPHKRSAASARVWSCSPSAPRRLPRPTTRPDSSDACRRSVLPTSSNSSGGPDQQGATDMIGAISSADLEAISDPDP